MLDGFSGPLDEPAARTKSKTKTDVNWSVATAPGLSESKRLNRYLVGARNRVTISRAGKNYILAWVLRIEALLKPVESGFPEALGI